MAHPAAEHKRRRGLARWWHAWTFSRDGLRAAWDEAAFRSEALAAIAMLPAALWLGQNWVERSLLAGSVLAVLVVELLNTAVEAAIDRGGSDWHPLAKQAKDLGSAAVLLSIVACVWTWGLALWDAARRWLA